MVTVEHVAVAMGLSDLHWKQVDILEGENKQTIDVRILRLTGSHSEKIAVLELRTAFSSAQALQIRMEPLASEEQVAVLAYPANRQRFVGGRFIKYGDSDKLAGTALLEMFDGDDRLVLDHGASGAPVLDCEGRVVAVVSNIFTQTLQFPSRAIRISTAWGSPNVASVPIQVLQEFSQAK
jgi:hypothetical protein